MKKYIVLFLVCAMVVSFVPNSANAYTTSDLYKKIQELSKQVTSLQADLSALVLKAVSGITIAPKTLVPATIIDKNVGNGEDGTGNEFVYTDSATNITESSATLRGHFGGYFISAGDNIVKFKYGEDSTLIQGSYTTPMYIEDPAGSPEVTISVSPSKTYYFRLEVTPPSSSGLAHKYGEIKSFDSLAYIRNGVCGSANNQSFVSAPTENLCANWTNHTNVTGTTQWNWSCLGIHGGVNINCAAKRIDEIAINQNQYIVPSGVTYLLNGISKIPSIELFGAGGGGSCRYSLPTVSIPGGAGGGGGEYKKLTNVNANLGEILDVALARGGEGGICKNDESDRGDDATGTTQIRRHSTQLLVGQVSNGQGAISYDKPGVGFIPASGTGFYLNGFYNGGKGGGINGGNGGKVSASFLNSSYSWPTFSGENGGVGGGGGGSVKGSNGGNGGNGKIIITYPFVPAVNTIISNPTNLN